MRLFEVHPVKRVSIQHVKAHAGTVGNERADALAKLGAALRLKLTQRQQPSRWFRDAVEQYWGNRNS